MSRRLTAPMLSALLWLVSAAVPSLVTPANAAGEQAADFTLRSVDGTSVSLSDYRGKVVLVNFWATWCQPCQVEMPQLQKMYGELGPQGFVVLSVSADDARSSSQVKPLIKRGGYTFPVLLDTETTVVSQYNPNKVLPYSVLVDREGRILEIFQGYKPGEEVTVRQKVVSALGAPAPTPAQ